MAFLSAKQLKDIENAVAAAEKKTCGEIVPMIARSSAGYSAARACLIITGFIVCSLVYIYKASLWGAQPVKVSELIIWQALSMALGGVLSNIPFLRRIYVSQKRMTAEAQRAAKTAFFHLGLTETAGRTGILIFISLFEKRAVIIADKGINQNVTPGYWQQQVSGIVKGIKTGKTAEAIIDAIAQIGDKLAEKFPPLTENINELPNHVRVQA